MLKLIVRLGLTFALIGVFPKISSAQAKKVEKIVERRGAQLQKQEDLKKQKSEEVMQARRQKHIDIQTKEVQKRMKKSKKKSKRLNDNKKEFFLTRWFRK